MIKFVVIALLIPMISFGQKKSDYADVLPNHVTAKPLLDTSDFISDSIRMQIINYLPLKGMMPSNYFMGDMYAKNDTGYIGLWHIDGLKRLKEVERENEKSKLERKNEIISLVGNPGGCLSIVYDIRNRKIIRFVFWQ